MECQIRKHDSRQIEIKVSYPLQRESRRDRFRFELFAFIPYQLGLDSDTYSREEFYEDLVAYTRFKTPPLTFREILNPQLATSPLNRIRHAVEEARGGGAWDAQRLEYELKMLAVMVRVHVRDSIGYVLAHVTEDKAGDGAFEDLCVILDRMLDGLADVLGQLRAIQRDLMGPGVPEQIARTVRLVDEYVSLQVEALLIRLLKTLSDDFPGRQDLSCVTVRLAKVVADEQQHREKRGYPTVVSPDDSTQNEYLLYRDGLLKKFASKVLFLSVARRRAGRKLQHALYALAAALAMTIGVMGLWVANLYYPGNAMALGLVAVVIYVVRDRIKDAMREVGGRATPRWVCDRRGNLIDPQTEKRVGFTRESVSWRERDELPERILQSRQYHDTLERAVSEPTDQVIHYKKDVVVRTSTIYKSHERSEAIDDILRLHVGHWLAHMDNPRKRLYLLDDDGADVQRIKGRRVYHVNLIARLTSLENDDAVIKRVKVILCRSGIERIEER